MEFPKTTPQQPVSEAVASDRRPFRIVRYEQRWEAGGLTVSIQATSPYSDATWWWIFRTGSRGEAPVISVGGSSSFDLDSRASRHHVPGNILDLASTLLDAALGSRDCPRISTAPRRRAMPAASLLRRLFPDRPARA
jgi:hypothetical protein